MRTGASFPEITTSDTTRTKCVEGGRKDDREQPTNAVCDYMPTTQSWTEACTDDISHTELDDTSYALEGWDDNDDDDDGIDGGRRLTNIPRAGCPDRKAAEGPTTTTRDVSNVCAICLSTFDVTDEITWAGNPHCTHVFHAPCIMHWLDMAGRKHVARERRHRDRHHDGHVNTIHNTVDQIINFAMLCPCCRQPFVSNQSIKDDENVLVDSDSATNDTAAIHTLADTV